MPLYRPKELLSFLNQLKVRPRKSLSQNFLVDGNIIRKIITLANMPDGQVVLEVGPGPGALTEALLKSKHTVIAVEKDKVFAENLSRLKKIQPTLTVISEDFLKLDLQEILPPSPCFLIANLPYHLTSSILQKICFEKKFFQTAILMVQKEVAKRICANPNTKEYGSLSIFVQFHADVKIACTVSKNCFLPKPSVDSALIRLDFKQDIKIEEKKFFRFVRFSFQKRRKILINQLQKAYPKENWKETFSLLNLESNIRAENLSLDKYFELFKYLEERRNFR